MIDLRVFSFGGGVQSTAVLVLAAQGVIAYDAFVFANVGADSENPDTLDYVEQYTKPFALEHHLPFVEVTRTRRDGTPVTLRAELERVKRSVILPIRLPKGKGFGNRTCTTDFKIRVIDKWIRQRQPRPERAVVGLGISLDEYTRMRSTDWHDVDSQTAKKPHKLGFMKRREYPLIDLRLSRASCQKLIHEAGLPPPPKSSCYFCPFHNVSTWIEMKRRRPDLFAKAVEVEQILNTKRVDVGRDGVFLHPYLRPLDEAVSDQLPMFSDDDNDSCESGYCMT